MSLHQVGVGNGQLTGCDGGAGSVGDSLQRPAMLLLQPLAGMRDEGLKPAIKGRLRVAYENVWLTDDDEFPGMSVGYVRVSAVTDDVAECVEAQKTAIHGFVEDRGRVVVRWYVDESVTGEGFDGPALQRMLTDAESGVGGFPSVFVWTLNRLSRNTVDLESVLRRLTDAGVGVVSVREKEVVAP